MPEERLRDVVEGGRAVSEEQDVVVLHGPPHHPVKAEWTGVRGRLPPGLGRGRCPGGG